MRNTMLDLFQKYLDNRISQQELAELMAYLGRPENRDQLDEWVADVLSESNHYSRSYQCQSLLNGLDDRVLGKVKDLIATEHQMSEKRIKWWHHPLVAALAVALTVGIGFYLYQHDAQKAALEKASIADIGPGGNRAILTLEGGSPVELDSSQVGVETQGGEVRYEGGALVTKATSGATESVPYATLATPKGGQYRITLPDGTKVYLNAASSLKYPTQFVGDSREVVLIGEAYFEVAQDKQKPFVVNTKGQQVRVLGTQFNVNAYPDEQEVTTTLVKGSVEIFNMHTNRSNVLKPGEQALLRENNMTVAPVDVAYYTGWKEGRFTFNRTGLAVILRQIERWYDIEFDYHTPLADEPLWGTLSRDVMLSQLLEALELNTGYTFKREGRRVTVSQ